MTDHLDSKNLVPFSKRRRSTFQLPGIHKDRDEEMLEQVDPDLRPEDEGLIRRYLHYADTLLGSSPDVPNLTLVPDGTARKPSTGDQLRPINISSFAPPRSDPAEHRKSDAGKSEHAVRPESAGEVANNGEAGKQDEAELVPAVESQADNSTRDHEAEEADLEVSAQPNSDDGDNGRAA